MLKSLEKIDILLAWRSLVLGNQMGGASACALRVNITHQGAYNRNIGKYSQKVLTILIMVMRKRECKKMLELSFRHTVS